MLDFLGTLFQSLAPLWEMSVTAAYAAAVVVALRLLLKKRAPRQVLCLLWLVVFARLLIPVSLESPLSIVPNALPGQEQQIHLPNQPSGAGTPVTPIQPHSPAQNSTPNQPANDTVIPVNNNNPTAPSLTVPEGVTPTVPQPEAPASFPWQAVLAGVWLAGAAALALYALFSYFRLRRCLFDAIRAQDGAWEHPTVNSPFILGFVRPRIYLPAGLTGQPRQFILCHERAHLRRLDHIVKPVCWAALALHWFNPVVWLAFILMSRDIEAACDEAVIRRLGPKVKADYSATLLALATNRRVPAPCPLAFDEGDAKGRIKNVLRYRRPALWIVVVSVVMAIMAAVCLLTDPVAAKGPDADPGPDASSSQEPVNLADTLLDPWMREVLDGERSFSPGGDAEFNIHQLRAMVYGDEELPKVTVEVGRLAILDLDRDGINEMVVWPTGEHDDPTEVGYYTGYFVFRRWGDTVRVYWPGWRSIGDLKADGTFEWSGSAFEWGTGSARFTENGFEIEQITWLGGSDKVLNFVDGQRATQEEFEAAIKAQNAKPDPTWYTYANGVLAPWLPDNLELLGRTDPAYDTGEAKLWLEGGEIPWLEWNGSTSRLNGLITPAQFGTIRCRDLDGDGQDEVVLTWYINGFAQLDLYEWDGSRPVLMDSYDTQQLLVRFNQNNVAAYNKDTRELTVTYSHTEGSMDDEDYYRHLVMGHALVPEDFFDGGYEHIRDGYPHVYANGFHLSYLNSDTNEYYFDFEFYLADETMQELNYVDTLLAEPPYSEYAGHYMIGKPVGVTGFTLRYDGTQWRVQEADALNMDYSGQSASPISIPLDDDVTTGPVPDFLDTDQQLLYRQALTMYRHIFGANTESVDDWPGGAGYQDNTMAPGGYAHATGLYSNWDDFEEAVLSVFTREFWETRNETTNGIGDRLTLYKNIDGQLYYIPAARGSYGCNPNFPETFRLVEQTEDTISFIMTGYYSDPWPMEGESYEDRDARIAAGWEYSVEYSIRMIKTENSWRFDEFYTHTDNGIPGRGQRIENPNAPTAMTSSPEPSSEPSPAPTACEHGLDNAISGWSNGYLVLTCDLDGAAYPVPAVTQGGWEPGISEDFDGDGHVELSFFQNGLMMIVDMEAGQLVTSVFDPDSTFAAFDQGRTWEMAENYTALTVSYLGRTVQVPLYISGGPSFPEVVIYRSFTPESIYPFTSETIYPHTRYVFRGGHFDMSSPVELGKVYADSMSLSAHWSVRYTGGGFQVISDSFQFELVPW